jgi:hypothetical protein
MFSTFAMFRQWDLVTDCFGGAIANNHRLGRLPQSAGAASNVNETEPSTRIALAFPAWIKIPRPGPLERHVGQRRAHGAVLASGEAASGDGKGL